eukprot:GGOE01045423.1.p1 GENE.GGOE01045423.1~~GGOE01045423.1.p1  ORF type:complete len:192 (+),score=40.61 GGOE01045423.1:123-698(+)
MKDLYHVDDVWLQAGLTRSYQRKVVVRYAALVVGVALITIVAVRATNQHVLFASPATSRAIVMQAIPMPVAHREVLAHTAFREADAPEFAEAPLHTVMGSSPSLATVRMVLGSLCTTAFAAVAFWCRSCQRRDLVIVAMTGVVKWYSRLEGFGYIVPDDGSPELFVHQSSINSTSFLCWNVVSKWNSSRSP